MSLRLVILGGTIFIPFVLHADFSYTETSRISGGAMLAMTRTLGIFSKSMRKLGEPQVSTVYLKGNRMAHLGQESGQIWDLDSETLTEIDFANKTYSTITFAQWREALEKMLEKSQAQVKEAQAKLKDAQAEMKESQAEVKYRFDVKETGKTKTIGGLNAREVIVTMVMDVKDKKSAQQAELEFMSSIWLVDSVPGYEEVNAFNARLAQKMASTFAASSMGRQMQGMMATNPQLLEGAKKMAQEAEKLKGVQVLQVFKYGTNLDPATAGEVSPQPAGPPPTAGNLAGQAAKKGAEEQVEKQTLGRLAGRLGGLGGLGGFGRRSRKEEPKPEPQAEQAPAQGQPNAGLLMEFVSEVTNFSTAAVDSAKFTVPAGFKQVEHPLLKALR